MATETPLATVKRLYGSKEKLIDKIASDAKADDESVAEAKERLTSVSNKKLLRIATVNESIKDDHGSYDKLIDAVAAAHGKAKDADYKTSLAVMPKAKLLDLLNDHSSTRTRKRRK